MWWGRGQCIPKIRGKTFYSVSMDVKKLGREQALKPEVTNLKSSKPIHDVIASSVGPSAQVGQGNGETPWKFHRVPQVSQFTTKTHDEKNFWKNLDNHKNYFDHLSKELNFTSLDDWYDISLSQFCQSGRNLLNSYYQSSYIKALQVRLNETCA